MRPTPYFSPDLRLDAFNCPHCNAYAQQKRGPVWCEGIMLKHATATVCEHCSEWSLWKVVQLVYPRSVTELAPSVSLSEELADDYREAAEILQVSPRGAAALLRLVVQNLCIQLGEKGIKINDDIAALVSKGLPSKVQEALDTVRVVGNDAVHPGTMDMRDNIETARALFGLVNFIADKMIGEPNEVDRLYKTLPPTKIAAIESRDKKQAIPQKP